MKSEKPVFAPQLYIPHGTRNIDFYIRGLGAKELRRFSNDDGTIHVSELSIDGAMFHLHEDTERVRAFSPGKEGSTSVIVGLFVNNVDVFVEQALKEGAAIISPAQDYDYGYRQAQFRDPFGHIWMIEKKI